MGLRRVQGAGFWALALSRVDAKVRATEVAKSCEPHGLGAKGFGGWVV